MTRAAWQRLYRALAASLLVAGLVAACSVPDFKIADTAANQPDSSISGDCAADPASCPDAAATCEPTCENDHGTTRCVAAECQPICASGFADCNGDPSDGCETDLSTDDNCGACGSACALTNATASCQHQLCAISKCAAGFADCDGNPKNGCEADLSKPETCGACTTQCSANGGSATCNAVTCGISCSAGHADCVNGLADGCETDLSANVLHCGSCDKACPAAGGTPTCLEGKCGVSDCAAPLADCNGDGASPTGDGCETDTSTDAANCGGCGIACYFPNASAKCVGKMCEQDTCSAGYADCTDASGCETKLGTTSNCLTCNDACNNDHGTSACGASGCVPSCARDWGDCDGNPNNGCETPLTSLTDCGACGVICSFTHATASCATGSCTQGGCDTGWADCTSAPGCETEGSCSSGTGGTGGGGGTGGSGSICSQSGFAFCDDFEDGNATGWQPNGGTWTVTSDGSFVYTGGNGSFQSSAGSTAWTNVSLAAKLKVVSFGGASSAYRAGIVARYNGSSNDYVLALDATGNLVLMRGMSAVSGSGTCGAIFVGGATGAWHTLQLDATGPSGNVTLKTYFDGTPEQNCVTTSSTSANGEIALVTVGGGTKAEFDDVRVTLP